MKKVKLVFWALGCLSVAFFGMILIHEYLIEFSVFGYLLLTAGFVEAWDTLADVYRFGDFDTADELRKGNRAVSLYYFGRVLLVLGAAFIANAAL